MPNFMRVLEDILVPDQRVWHKLVLLGDGAVGKTALVHQTCLHRFPEKYDPTIEDSYTKQVTVGGADCMLDILDTAGQEEYIALRDQWIRDCEAVVLIYSISSRSSFSRIKRFYDQVERVRDKSTPICLVGNKSDKLRPEESLFSLVRSDPKLLSSERSYKVAESLFNIDSILGGAFNKELNAKAHMVNLLPKKGAGINARSPSSVSPLQDAAAGGRLNVVKSLIQQGANRDQVSQVRGTALHAAVKVLRDEKAEKSGITLPKQNKKPNLPVRQGLGGQDGLPGSTNSNEQDNDIDDGDDGDDDDDYRRIPEHNTASVLTNEVHSEVVLTSEFDFDFSKNVRTPISPKPPIQDMGFTTLQNPPQARVDIVFVHGLQGHPEKTWTFKNETERVPLSWRERLLLQKRRQRAVGTTVCWPYDLLCVHEDFASSRIMTWGYDTKVIREFFGGSDSQNISQHGNNLLVTLQLERRDDLSLPS
ncbi:hypothetical protein FGRMN_6746 [Fusarium graminum]|nr:hypothetical protein FGRMN_6746 [Fusarium graminum]